MKKLYFFLLLVFTGSALYAQPTISLSKVYGGNNNDNFPCAAKLPNGDIVIAATTQSTNLGQAAKGQQDIWLLRLKPDGDTIWTKIIGGDRADFAHDILINKLGQIIILGQTFSKNSGDIGAGTGYGDFLFLKINAVDGNILASKTFGGKYGGSPGQFIEISNNRYLVCGQIEDANKDVSGPLIGSFDGWIAILDSNGNVIDDNNYGGTNSDEINDIIEASDGNYYFVGTTKSNDVHLSNNYGGDDGWIGKVDTALNLIWSRNIGGSDYDLGYTIREYYDGSLLVGGYTMSDDNDLVNVQNTDPDEGNIFLYRVDTSGKLLWVNCYGGTEQDYRCEIIVRGNNEILVAASTFSDDGDVSNNNGDYDVWMINLDSNSNIRWEQNFGGTSTDEPLTLLGNDTGNVYVVAQSRSNDIDVPNNNGPVDIWMFKLCMPADTSITKSNYTYTNTHNYMGATYQWVDCNNNYSPLSGATNKIYTATKNGDYALIINTGCRQDTTNCFNVSGISTDITAIEIGNEVTLYPNPGEGTFFIEYDRSLGLININVTDITGKKVHFQTKQSTEGKAIISLDHASDGLYIVGITQGANTHYFKVLKK